MEFLRENKQVIRHIWPYIWARGNIRLQVQFAGIVGLMTIERVANIMRPMYSKWIVDSLAGPKPFCYDLIVKLAILEIIEGNADSFRYRLTSKITAQIKADIQLDLFHHLHRLPLQWHLAKKTGEIMEIIKNGTDAIWSVFDIWLDVIPGLFDFAIALLVFMLNFDFAFSALIFGTMAAFLAVQFFMAKFVQQIYKEKSKASREYQSTILDSLINYETIKYYCAEEYEYGRFKEAKERKLRLSTSEWYYQSSRNLLADLALNIGFMWGTVMLAQRIFEGKRGFSAGDYVLYGNYVSSLKYPVLKFFWRFDDFNRRFVDINLVMALLEERAETICHEIGDGLEMESISGSIEFQNVSFRYLMSEKPVLQDLSFRIEAGQTLALVGESGSGKSTLIRLLFRLIEPQEGQILFNGVEIGQYSLGQFRQAIGVVPQDCVLFNDTIGQNIRYGRREAGWQEVEKAAKAAQIHAFIASHPDGYNCQVGDRGLKLSGGEKQRVAIARTILKHPKYLLLDEATSSLDSNTERAIQTQLEGIRRNRTCVLVAHRLSTVMNAHKILVLHRGRVVESGSHAELLAKGGSYAKMWRVQIEANRNAQKEEDQPEEGAGNLHRFYGHEQNGGQVFPLSSSSEGPSSDYSDDFEEFY